MSKFISAVLPVIGSIFGGPVGGALGGAIGGGLSGGGLSGVASGGLTGGLGSSLLGGLGGGLGGITGGGMTGGSAGGSSLFSPLSSIIGGFMQRKQADDMRDELITQQTNARAALEPYQQTGLNANSELNRRIQSGELGSAYTAEDFQADPGYQFRLEQGNQALERSQAARGNLLSGQAIKEAQNYNQGLADQTYNDAYNRNIADQQNQFSILGNAAGQGFNAAQALGDVYTNIGNIQANTKNAQYNALSRMIGGF